MSLLVVEHSVKCHSVERTDFFMLHKAFSLSLFYDDKVF